MEGSTYTVTVEYTVKAKNQKRAREIGRSVAGEMRGLYSSEGEYNGRYKVTDVKKV